MKVVALIGARAGSSLKDKNIRMLAGHPLIAYSIKAAQKAGIKRVVVSTDSVEYAAIAKNYGAEVPFLQPKESAGSDSGDYPFIRHAIDWMASNEESPLPDFIVHLRPTTPFRDPRIIDAAVTWLVSHRDATALRSVQETAESGYKLFEIEDNYLKGIRSKSSWIDEVNDPRQKFPKTYSGNGYVDVLSVKFVLGNGLLHGNQALPFITRPVVEVDTEGDFEMLEYQAEKNPDLVRRLFQ